MKSRTSEALADSLLQRSVINEETGCRLWLGVLNEKGYGRISYLGSTTPVHRVAHIVWVGPIPDGYDVDHVYDRGCRHRNCINPDHLEAVSHAENCARAKALLTHCAQGHPYDEQNTLVRGRKNGRPRRDCRACQNAANRAYRARVRAL